MSALPTKVLAKAAAVAGALCPPSSPLPRARRLIQREISSGQSEPLGEQLECSGRETEQRVD